MPRSRGRERPRFPMVSNATPFPTSRIKKQIKDPLFTLVKIRPCFRIVARFTWFYILVIFKCHSDFNHLLKH